jgi:hypothetical protein
MAGTDWLNAFLKRNSSLSISRPEATTFARAMDFNLANIITFFVNLSKVFDENKFETHNVYNASGILVAVCVAVNATGNCVSPMFVFPRKNLVIIF